VNDLERDLREVLHDDALRVSTSGTAPEGLSRSAHRRQAVFVGLVGLAGAVVVAGIVIGATTLLSTQSGPKPAALGPKTTGTLNGVTITYPSSWKLIDPDTAGLNGSPMMGESPLPRVVLALAPTEATETFGCPGQVGGDAASTSLMTIQEEPLAVGGAAKTPWPVELGPMEIDTSESGCYPGWTFERAVWTASGRTFDATIGFSPDASDEEHDAMVAAFDSMTFEPPSEAASSATVASGNAGGTDWILIAGRDAEVGLTLTLDAGTGGSGTSFRSPPEALHPVGQPLGTGSDREVVAYGAVPVGVTRVEATAADGSVVSEDVADVPDQIDPDLDAYALVLPPGPATLRGYDASGEVVIEGALGRGEGLITTETSLEDGRHFGYVRSVDPDRLTLEFDLAYFLSGKEANDAYHAAGGTGPVPNDHFVVNDNPKLRTLHLSPDVRLRLLDWNHCCETFFDGDLGLFAQAVGQQADVTDGELIYRGQSSWWITIENGLVTEIEEQYAP
jgi:hypothetical protein